MKASGFRLTLAISAASGFIALSYEILWYRAISFVSWSIASAFGVLLGAYLTGIAVGASLAGWLCKARPADADASASASQRGRELRLLAAFTLVANLVGFAVVPSLTRVVQHHEWPWVLPVVGLAAALLGAVFPLVSHFGIAADARAGVQLSYVYVANIIGSAAGSLLTGFVLLDHLSYAAIALVLALAGVALAAALGFLGSGAGTSPAARAGILGVCAAAALGLVVARGPAFDHLYERLLYRGHFAGQTFAEIVENRSGVITVTDDGTVYGGGAYDGRFNVSLESDENLILRAYGIGALHPAPRHVLMIGLSSGSWAQVIANLPGVEALDIVEINPGYEQIIARHPTVASLLANPKVHIFTDDGRRWLLRHPDARFDFIVQNTTWNWRAHITDLESVDYLEIVRRHLAPGALFYFNTTESDDVQRTAAMTFPYALRVYNFMAVSESPVVWDDERWQSTLRGTIIDGAPAFDLSTEKGKAAFAESLARGRPNAATRPFESRSSVLARTAAAGLVTDDNMLPEWRQVLRFPPPP
jgi:spermidine synthase